MKKYILIISFFLGFTHGYSQNLNDSEGENYMPQAIYKIDKFRKYIAIIGSKDKSYKEKELAITQACTLFLYDTVSIQVSYCPTEGSAKKYSHTLKEYLRTLSRLSYDTITIDEIEIAKIENIRKDAYGNNYGTISVSQKFTGTKGGYTYEDVTTKNVEILLNPYLKPDDLGESKKEWGTLLSTISITEPCL